MSVRAWLPVVLGCVILLPTWVASAQDRAAERLEGLRNGLEEAREQERLLTARMADGPRSLQAWQNRLSLAQQIAGFENMIAHGGKAPRLEADERNRLERARVWRLTEAWAAEYPGDSGPLLLRELWISPESLDDWVAGLAERFPTDTNVLELRVRRLAQTDRGAEATALLRSFVTEHPQAADGRRLLYDRLQKSGDAAGADEILRAWRRDIPADPLAVRHWTDPRVSSRLPTPAEVLEAVRDVDPAWSGTGSTGSTRGLCQHLERTAEGRYPEAAGLCYERVLAVADPESSIARSALEGLVKVAARMGDRDALDRTLAALPSASRAGALVSLASSYARSARCGEVLALVPRLLPDGGDHLGTLSRALLECRQYPGSQRALFEVAEVLPADQWSRLISDLIVAPELVATLTPVLVKRHREAPETATWQALDLVGERYGDPVEHVAMLEAWHVAAPDNTQVVERLGEKLVQLGRIDRALELYETNSGPDSKWYGSQRMDLWMATGQLDRAREHARARLAADPDDSGALWLGRIAHAEGDLAEADRRYVEYLETGDSWRPEDGVLEVAEFRAESGDELGLLELLERHWWETERNSAGSMSLYLSRRLTELERPDLAESYLRVAEEGGVEAAALDGRLVQARRAGNPEALEAAYRELMAHPQASYRHWAGLPKLLLDFERPVEALEVLDEAERRIESLPVSHYRLRIEALLATGEPRRAIAVARDLIETGRGDGFVYQLLRRGYRELFQREG